LQKNFFPEWNARRLKSERTAWAKDVQLTKQKANQQLTLSGVFSDFQFI